MVPGLGAGIYHGMLVSNPGVDWSTWDSGAHGSGVSSPLLTVLSICSKQGSRDYAGVNSQLLLGESCPVLLQGVGGYSCPVLLQGVSGESCPVLLQGLILQVGCPCRDPCVPRAMLSHVAQWPMLLRQGNMGVPTWDGGGPEAHWCVWTAACCQHCPQHGL